MAPAEYCGHCPIGVGLHWCPWEGTKGGVATHKRWGLVKRFLMHRIYSGQKEETLMSRSSFEGMDRRTFLKLTSVGIAAGSLASLIGCSPEAIPTEETAPPPTAVGPKTLRFGLGTAQGPAETADPALGTSNADTVRGSNCYDQLVWLDDELEPQPMLAESWEPNDAADVWTYHLRDGVKFHNGDKLTAADVVYTYRRILDPDTGSPGQSAMVSLDPDGIEAVDDLTVRFRLPRPIVDLHYVINNRFTYIVPDGATEADLRTTGMGTGPFKMEHFVPGEDPGIFVKNEDYWMEGAPAVDVFELRSIPETGSRFAALRRGLVDVIQDPPREQLDEIESDQNLQVLTQRSATWQGFAMQTDTPPFDNNDLRLALKYAMDRTAMLNLILQGYGQLAYDIPVGHWVQYGWPESESKRERDLDKAKEHLTKAGYGDGLELELFYSELEPNWPILATMLREQVAEIGVDLKLTKTPDDTYWSETWLKKPFFTTVWSMRAADAMLSIAYTCDADWNETNWCRPEFDNTLSEARQTLDEDKRTQLWHDAQRLIRDDGGNLIPFFQDTLAAAVSNVSWTPPARTNFWNFRRISFKA